MDTQLVLQIAALVVLLFLSAFFSSAETALIAVSKIKLRTMAEEGNKKAQLVLNIFKHEDKMLSAILIGNNLVNTVMASIASLIAFNFGGFAVSLATFIITFLILVFGEITPKTLATKYSEKLSLLYAPVISFLMKILTPVIWVINLLSNMILRLLGTDLNAKTALITESELQTILDVSHEEGVIEDEEREMIRNVFDFSDAKASQIMVPRSHVVAIDVHSSYEDILDLYRREKFTRIPVYEGDSDNIIGVINMKDFILLDPKDFKMSSLLRKAYFTVETKPIADLLEEMQKDAYNMTIVLDEYGDLAGVITVEDIIEEIVGEVQDEYDTLEKDNIRKIADRSYVVKGFLSLHDLNDELDLDLDSEDFESVGGLIIEKLGRFPKLYEQIELDNGMKLKVIQLIKNRIEEVRITLPLENRTQDR